MSRPATDALARWRRRWWWWLLPLLVGGLALCVLALHQLSHGRSLVVTDTAVAGHHAIIAVGSAEIGSSAAADPAAAHRHGWVGEPGGQPQCGQLCDHPSSIMVCLLALVLLAGCRLIRGPSQVRWFAFAWTAQRLGARVVVAPDRMAWSSPVSLLSLGVSRT